MADPELEGAYPGDFEPLSVDHRGDEIDVDLDAGAGGYLVLSEIWYPGWQATVNGSPQPVEKVNGILRGLYLNQPDRYQITLEYRPRSVVWGNWIAGVTVSLLILAGLGRNTLGYRFRCS